MALQVRVDHGVPVLFAKVRDLSVDDDAGVVDEQVQPAKALDARRDETLHIVAAGDVPDDGLSLSA